VRSMFRPRIGHKVLQLLEQFLIRRSFENGVGKRTHSTTRACAMFACMIQVQSSWFPLADVNPQTFTDIPNAKLSDFKKAMERVYHDKTEPSGVVVDVLQK
jgi:hypothetical protein